MWPEFLCVNAVNFAKEVCNNSRNMEFFPGDNFLARPEVLC